jgi:hypothetical protein
LNVSILSPYTAVEATHREYALPAVEPFPFTTTQIPFPYPKPDILPRVALPEGYELAFTVGTISFKITFSA